MIPFAIVPTGSIFGTWRILDTGASFCPETFVWGMTSGARSLFILPKISNSISHNRLRAKFHIKADKPSGLLDDWFIFKDIINSSDYGKVWKTDLLYFSLYDSETRPIYYSLQYSSAMEYSLKSCEKTTSLTDLYAVKSLINKYFRELAGKSLNVKDTRPFDVTKLVKFDYFHSNTGSYTEIKNSELIHVQDSSFAKAYPQHKKIVIPKNASFFNGCVRISRKV